jgi:uncharacterized OsmC-like protein
MRLIIPNGQTIILTELEEDGFTADPQRKDLGFGPVQMFVTSLGLCVYSALVSYAQEVQVEMREMSLKIRWHYEDHSPRVGQMAIRIDWPELPESHKTAAESVVSHCTLYHTLMRSPQIKTEIIQRL